jgi:quercetin dioxygenase-like cupin family protein
MSRPPSSGQGASSSRSANSRFEVGPGDAFVIPSGVTHGCRALEPGELIDSFAPRRDDFL